MGNVTGLVRDDAYEEMGSAYQRLQVKTLDVTMEEAGISDPVVRQKVCESFRFSMGQFHDQGWLKPSANADPVCPLLCFGTPYLNSVSTVDELGDLYAPSEMFAFHEYAIGNFALLYEGDRNADVDTGSVVGG